MMCVRDLLEMEKKIDEKIRMRKKRDKGTRRLINAGYKIREEIVKKIDESDAFSKNAFERECDDDDEIVTLLEGKWRID